MSDTLPAYKPIEDYGVIGNLRTALLIGRDGSIDWCCFPHMPDPSVFAAILDWRKGGRFRVSLADAGYGSQRYIEATNVLETIFEQGEDRLVVTDFMPLRGNIDGTNDSFAPAEIHRVITCEAGRPEVDVEWSPRFDYARARTMIYRAGQGFLARSEDAMMSLAGIPEGGRVEEDSFGPAVKARFHMKAGDTIVLTTRWYSNNTDASPETTLRLLEETVETWQGWVHKAEASGAREWAGPWSDIVVRSELALKLMTHADTGAIAAAPTTSLPEGIGGVRNWDYRYSWIRDAGMAAQALHALGHTQEACAFLQWAEHVEAREANRREERFQIVYGLRGEADLDELELDHFEGYRQSRPVHIGNGAAKQGQLDIYGEALTAAYELLRMGEDLDEEIWSFLNFLSKQAHSAWKEKDYGIWEMRSGPQHFTYSKAMVWGALKYAIYLDKVYGMDGSAKKWKRTQKEILDYLLDECFDHEQKAFVQAAGSKAMDAANLKIALMEMLPFRDPHIQGTINAVMEHLMTDNDLVYRYRTDDGLPGEEGTFVLCTFWLVDVLALSGRLDEAHRIFDGIANRANHLGLYSEQIDPHTGAFLGNFPQAFSHIGFINSTLYLAHAEGKELPIPAPLGSEEQKEQMERRVREALAVTA